jgi:hypothetical protein
MKNFKSTPRIGLKRVLNQFLMFMTLMNLEHQKCVIIPIQKQKIYT